MDRRVSLVLVVPILALAIACGPLGNLGDMVSGSQAGTAASLWLDVPPFPGAEKVDLELPVVMRLAVEAASKAIMREAGDAAGNLEFIAFATDASADEVESFYTTQRMVGEGWADREDVGCGVSSGMPEASGAMCAFYREGAEQDSILIIIVGQADEGQTAIYYVRMDANPEAMATAAAD
jgi:hypothetical protein